MLSVKHLSKEIDGRPTLCEVSFEIEQGSIVGLLGRNGAGKTTLLRTMTGILDPEEGCVEFEGKDVHRFPEYRRQFVYVPDSTEVFVGYTPDEWADFYAAIYPAFDKAYYGQLMERFELPRRKKIKHFSKGMKALTAMIMAFSARVRLILLDEPTNGLDPIVKKQVLAYLVEEVAETGVSLIISSHHLEEIERIADTVIWLKNGRVEEVTVLEQLKNSLHKLQIVFKDEAPAALLEMPNVRVISKVGRVYTVLIEESGTDTVRLFEVEQPILLEKMPIRLEDVYAFKLGGERHV
ncbi:ABC transporter ATP-binding protein [Aneurinibacillus migulanus]|uniref:ABC transporter ATP-binding protein n=1 Tax=Aneurinibacillus migulanus TaxID=47500 RepID=UPI00209D049B|nr:ABC transporter ATP-binding protein [Aneurinibacillus migulanus]MCP1355692.1 ABC transporter ATP-binding protein [Aneurinibacillus migulanus]